jgi:cytochrome P450
MTVGEGATINGRFVPPGIKVYVTQSAAYRSSRNFADVNSFVPERWLKNPPAKYANDNRKVLQPFSVGPRNCIGRKSVVLLSPDSLKHNNDSW